MRAAVVIPIYKPLRADLKWYEQISLERCLKVLGHHPIVFVAPEGRQFDYLPSEKKYAVETFDAAYFDGIAGYNRLMLSPQFYERFSDYDYILLYQPDAFVFSDRLEEFCRLGYDYIGAPWSIAAGIRQKPYPLVGNGGFSLRRVRACFDVLRNNAELIRELNDNEDATFSWLGRVRPNEFRVAPIGTASRFSVEHLPERWCRKNENVLPFGCHGWYALSAEFYIKVFSEFGYDLEPYANLMRNCDAAGLEWNLRQAVTRRISARIEHGRPLMRYLPKDEEFFLFVADERAKAVAQRLYVEGLRIINPHNIPVLVNETILRTVAASLKGMTHRGLLVSAMDDSPIVGRLIELMGVGSKRFVSFWQEYMKSSAALLRRLSRPTVKRLINRGLV